MVRPTIDFVPFFFFFRSHHPNFIQYLPAADLVKVYESSTHLCVTRTHLCHTDLIILLNHKDSLFESLRFNVPITQTPLDQLHTTPLRISIGFTLFLVHLELQRTHMSFLERLPHRLRTMSSIIWSHRSLPGFTQNNSDHTDRSLLLIVHTDTIFFSWSLTRNRSPSFFYRMYELNLSLIPMLAQSNQKRSNTRTFVRTPHDNCHRRFVNHSSPHISFTTSWSSPSQRPSGARWYATASEPTENLRCHRWDCWPKVLSMGILGLKGYVIFN